MSDSAISMRHATTKLRVSNRNATPEHDPRLRLSRAPSAFASRSSPLTAPPLVNISSYEGACSLDLRGLGSHATKRG